MLRRAFVMGSAITLVSVASRRASGADTAEVKAQRLRNRLELWHAYAHRTRNLLARYTSTRHSSLLADPLIATGGLAFVAPDTLVMRDDGLAGSTTRIHGDQASIEANQASLPRGPQIDRAVLPAADWLGNRLIRLFAAGQPEALIAGCRTHVPRGRGHRMELLPSRGSLVRKVLRGLMVRFDPVGGAVIELEISEAQGDRVVIQLADHRQNVSDEELETVLGTASPGSAQAPSPQ